MDDLKAKVSLMMSAGAPVENTNTNPNEGLILSSLNGVWIDQRFPMKPSFKEIAETVFRAETNAVDFVNEVWNSSHHNLCAFGFYIKLFYYNCKDPI